MKGLLRATPAGPLLQQEVPETHGPITGLPGLVNGRECAWTPCNSSQLAGLSKPGSRFLVQPSKAVTPLHS